VRRQLSEQTDGAEHGNSQHHRQSGLESILKRLPQAEEVDALLHEVLDVAMEVAGADMGTLQHFDETNDCLRIVASRGFPFML
jgi:hypothetical protein